MSEKRTIPSALTIPSNGGLVQTISTTKNSIGYITLGYLTHEIKILKVNSIERNEKTALQGKYLISRPLYMFTNSWPKGATLNFINFIFPKKGQQLVKKAGSIPVY